MSAIVEAKTASPAERTALRTIPYHTWLRYRGLRGRAKAMHAQQSPPTEPARSGEDPVTLLPDPKLKLPDELWTTDPVVQTCFQTCWGRLGRLEQRVVLARNIGLSFAEIANEERITEVRARVAHFRALLKLEACMNDCLQNTALHKQTITRHRRGGDDA